jgi:hypothetical protein
MSHSIPYTAAALDLTLRDVIAALPHDAGAIVVLVLLGGFVLLIWYGSLPSTIGRYRSDAPADPDSTTEEPSEPATPGSS